MGYNSEVLMRILKVLKSKRKVGFLREKEK
jgi:hypothetical protein